MTDRMGGIPACDTDSLKITGQTEWRSSRLAQMSVEEQPNPESGKC